MIRSLGPLSVLLLQACGQDSGFTPLTDPEPPAEDTSAPPEEEPTAEPEPEPAMCPDRIYSAQVASRDEDCKVDPPLGIYTPVVEWKMDTFAEDPDFVQSMATPVVGPSRTTTVMAPWDR